MKAWEGGVTAPSFRLVRGFRLIDISIRSLPRGMSKLCKDGRDTGVGHYFSQIPNYTGGSVFGKPEGRSRRVVVWAACFLCHPGNQWFVS